MVFLCVLNINLLPMLGMINLRRWLLLARCGRSGRWFENGRSLRNNPARAGLLHRVFVIRWILLLFQRKFSLYIFSISCCSWTICWRYQSNLKLKTWLRIYCCQCGLTILLRALIFKILAGEGRIVICPKTARNPKIFEAFHGGRTFLLARFQTQHFLFPLTLFLNLREFVFDSIHNLPRLYGPLFGSIQTI